MHQFIAAPLAELRIVEMQEEANQRRLRHSVGRTRRALRRERPWRPAADR